MDDEPDSESSDIPTNNYPDEITNVTNGGKRYRKKGTKRRYGGFTPLPVYGGFNRGPLYGGQALSSPIPKGGKSRKNRRGMSFKRGGKSREKRGGKSRKKRGGFGKWR